MGFFDNTSGLYLRHPNGGVENIDDMKDKGFDYVLLSVHESIMLSDGKIFPKYSIEPWRKIMEKCDIWGMKYAPWARVYNRSDCESLRKCIDQISLIQNIKPAGCWNAEAEIETEEVKINDLNETSVGADTLYSMLPWAFEGINYGALRSSTKIDIQLFPSLDNEASRDPRSCRSRFYKLGFKGTTQFMNGIRDGGMPPSTREKFPQQIKGLYSVFTADDLNLDYNLFRPKLSLPFISEEEFLYKGPFYFGMKNPQIKIIKKTLHNGGFGDFSNPDEYYNKNLVRAMKAMQRQYGILASGQYGRNSWKILRILPSANRQDKISFTHALRG